MFSKATEYALRATIFIAQKSSEEKKLGLDDGGGSSVVSMPEGA